MNVLEIQQWLNKNGESLLLSGTYDSKTIQAVLNHLIRSGKTTSDPKNWSEDRRLIAIKQLICNSMGINSGPVDGLYGPQTRYALEVYESRKRGDTSAETWRDKLVVPFKYNYTPEQMKWPLEKDVPKVFGAVGSNQVMCNLPFPMRLAWDKKTTVNRFSCHKLVEPALSAIFKQTLDHYGYAQIKDLGLDLFGGCLNVRQMRGGTSMSMHSWGIAVDLDPDRNQLNWTWAKSNFSKPVYNKFWEIVERNGAVSLGRNFNYDSMHFQFARR